jgi:N-methylhydantoinase A
MGRMIGVDVGGTFTDIVEYGPEGVSGRKVPTTPAQAEGVVASVEGRAEDVFLHGTTAATNALLEERGARVSLVTDEGYQDLIEIGRQERPSLYDSSVDRPRPLVGRDMRFGVDGNDVLWLEELDRSEPDVVAVGLIESYADASTERELAERIGEVVDAPVLLSSEISPEFREYERLATTVLSAYLTPSVAGYLQALDAQIPMSSRLIMTSAGGLIPFAAGGKSAGRLVLSGPAGGAVAAAALGRHHGHKTILSFDMGGTSTDVCRISDGSLAVGSGHTVGGRVNRVPAVPIRTIGAGGGSVGWVDAGGSLRVGPRSAGSVPGPAAYGQGGTDPTVTDANIVAGNIPGWLHLGGTVELDRSMAEAAVGRLGGSLGLETMEAAVGILEVVDSHMEHALRSVSVEEGADPREAVLVAFGGAGGLHASKLARRLGMRRVLIPPLSGVFSALGLLLSSPRSDSARTVMMQEGDDRLGARMRQIEDEASRRYRTVFSEGASTSQVTADVRYVGQSHELEIRAAESWSEVRQRFEATHEKMFGFRRPSEPMEVVNLRAVANGEAPISWDDLPGLGSRLEPEEREGVWVRSSLPGGFTAEGPLLVIETNSAVLVGNDELLTVLDDGTLEIEIR